MRAPNLRKQLGERLVDSGLLTEDQLELALQEQKKSGKPLGKILQRLNYVGEDAILSVLAKQAGVEKVKIGSYHIPREVLDLIPYSLTRKLKLMPLSLNSNQLTITMANPFDITAVEEIERLTGCYIDIKASNESEVLKAIESYYKDFPISTEESPDKDKTAAKTEKEKEDVSLMAPVVKLVNQTIIQAAKEGATDIHLEPKEKELRSRFRIDGILRDGPSFPKNLQAAITTRIKIMANLNISESRLPQDGGIVFPLGKKKLDLRVSTLPNIFGEKTVLRILDKEMLVLGLGNLGFSSSNLAVFKDSILKSHGIILVTGPTGSGKTTTLYSALFHLNSKEKNIVTLEDPVEYELPELCQSQINLKAGLTFASGLRAILRQDPDIIMVGEMRDTETIKTAMRAAVTGHLVLSTLHTNDAVGAIARLLDMGAEAYLLSSSIVAILAQRLVRQICPSCRERVKPEKDILKAAGVEEKSKNIPFHQGKGCDRCYGTGYRGRIGIFEILPISSSIASLIAQGANSQRLENKAREEGMITIMENGLQKAAEGITTLEEVMRVAYGS